MKILVGNEMGSYSFNPSDKTIILSSIPDLQLEQLLLITNVTSNKMLYNFADPTLGATVTNNVITVSCSTDGMSATDALQILAEVPDPNYDMATDLSIVLNRLIKLLESNAVVDSYGRQRISVEAIPNVTVANMPATTNIGGSVTAQGTSLGSSLITEDPTSIYGMRAAVGVQAISESPVDQRWRIIDESHTAFATLVRPNLIFS